MIRCTAWPCGDGRWGPVEKNLCAGRHGRDSARLERTGV